MKIENMSLPALRRRLDAALAARVFSGWRPGDLGDEIAELRREINRRRRAQKPRTAKLPSLHAALNHFVRAASEALGADDLALSDLLERTKGTAGTLAELRVQHRKAQAAFLAGGGRGVDAAEEIDRLAVAIALRQTEAKFLRA